jgi:hypothetical protein
LALLGSPAKRPVAAPCALNAARGQCLNGIAMTVYLIDVLGLHADHRFAIRLALAGSIPPLPMQVARRAVSQTCGTTRTARKSARSANYFQRNFLKLFKLNWPCSAPLQKKELPFFRNL